MAIGSRRRKLGLESLEVRIVLDGAGWLSWDSSPWQNSVNPFDSNGDGAVSAGDAIWVQNAINSTSAGQLAAMVAPPALQGLVTNNAASAFLDTNGDGQLSAVDAISIANHINTDSVPAGAFPDGAIDDRMIDMGGDVAELPPFGTNGFGSVAGGLENPGDQDAFQIVPSHDRLSITGFELGDVDIAIQVYNEQQELVADTQSDTFSFPLSSASVAWQERLDLPVEPGQEYSIVIQNGDQGTTGDYVLDLLNYDFERWSDPAAEQPVNRPPIDAGDSLPEDLSQGAGSGLDDTYLTDADNPTPTFDGGMSDSFGTQGGNPTPTFDGGMSDSFGTQGGNPTPTFDGGMSDSFGTQGGNPTPTFDGGMSDSFGTQGGNPTPTFDGGMSDSFGTQSGNPTPTFDGGMSDSFGTQSGNPTPTFDGGMSDSFGTQGGNPTPTFDGGMSDSFGTQGGNPTPTFDGGMSDSFGTQGGNPTPTFDGGMSDSFGTQSGNPTPTFDGGMSDSFGTQGGNPTPTFDGGMSDSFGTQGGNPTPTFDGGMSDSFGTQSGNPTPTFDGGMDDSFGTQGGDSLPEAFRSTATSLELGFMGMGSASGFLAGDDQVDVFRLSGSPGTPIGIAAFGGLPLDIQVFDGQGQTVDSSARGGFPGTTQVEFGQDATLFIAVGGADSQYLGQYGLDVFQTFSWGSM